MAEECGEISICETDATISANQTEIRVRVLSDLGTGTRDRATMDWERE